MIIKSLKGIYKMEAYQYSAKFYDHILFPFIRPIRKRVVSLVKKYCYCAILDVCCGTGDQLKLLKQHGFDAEGIDISDAMLSVARSGEPKANCLHQDAAQMHYEDAKFDLVMTAFALHEKEHETARKIVEEMYRVTARDGNMLIVDYELGEETSTLSKILIYFIEWFAGKEHYRNFKTYNQKGGLPALLSGMSLTEVERYYFAKHGVVLLLLHKNKNS
jgi:demethylmenaquinone methyltransferase/2-methoxy-6-polyprenyl-1,4-benzoquinol methylase